MNTNVEYVDSQTLRKQIYAVEGYVIDIRQFEWNKKGKLDKLRYPAYPYTQKYKGDVAGLIRDRITPIIQQEIEVD